MFCMRCGAALAADDRYCGVCGAEASAARQDANREPALTEPEPTVELAPGDGVEAVGDVTGEVFIGGAASAAAAERRVEPGEQEAAGGFVLPDSAFEPQTQPDALAPSSTAPAVQVVAPPIDAAPEPAPKRKRGPVIAAVSAAVVLVAAVAVGLFFFPQNDETTEEPTRCSLVTLVVPEDEGGQPYSRYRATLKDPSGVVVSTLDVDDAAGFKIGDLTDKYGDYLLEISDPDTGAVLQQTPIRTDPSDTTSTIMPQPRKGGQPPASTGTAAAGDGRDAGQAGGAASSPAGGSSGGSAAGTADKTMNEAYLEVVEEKIDTYGNANVLWYKDEPNVLSGVCMAQLVDFDNDDQDELVVAYYDKAVADQKVTDAWRPEYNVEVYTFNESKAKRAYSKKVTLAADDFVGLDIVQPAEDDAKPVIVERAGTGDNQETTYLALETPDGFEAVSTVSVATDSKGKVSCKVEGKDASVEEYQEVVNKYEEGCDRTVYLFDVGEQPDGGTADSDVAGKDPSSSTSSGSSSSADEQPVTPEPAATRVVKCADELASIEDTIAVLRSDEPGSASSSAGEPETVTTEAAARAAISRAAGAEPAQVFWADFDGDGTFEAFGVVGEPYGDEVVAPRGMRITLWFVAKDKAEKVGDDVDAVGVWPSQLQSGEARFLKLVPDTGGDAGGSQAEYYGVKDGAAAAFTEEEVNRALKS